MRWALDSVSLRILRGECLAVVGDSGAGKSTLAKVIMGFEPSDAGAVYLNGTKLESDIKKRAREVRRKLQIVFQDPANSLDPRQDCREVIEEALLMKGKLSSQKADHLFQLVGLPISYGDQKTRKLSGGEQQRLVIARALALEPDLLIADEPTASLDAPLKIDISDLLSDLKKQKNLAILLITHELPIAMRIADKVAVMYGGKIVEQASKAKILDQPIHPYSRRLLQSMRWKGEEAEIEQNEAAFLHPEERVGCIYKNRCEHASQLCHEMSPELQEALPDHYVSCHYTKSLMQKD
ncbi:MAG: dipeptide ABC transporter ATP-binding protein [Calditrichia bacterium]